MSNLLVITLTGAEQAIAPGIFIRRDTRHLWIRFRDQRGRKQRESTPAVYGPGATPGTVIVHRGELKKAQRQLDRRRGEVASQRFVGAVERTLKFEELMTLMREDYQLKGRRSTASLESRIANLAGFFGGVRVSGITPGWSPSISSAGSTVASRRSAARGGTASPAVGACDPPPTRRSTATPESSSEPSRAPPGRSASRTSRGSPGISARQTTSRTGVRHLRGSPSA